MILDLQTPLAPIFGAYKLAGGGYALRTERNMSRHAFILGGTGQIGRAVANEFLSAGWTVTISHRGAHTTPADLVERGVKAVTLNRDIPGQLSRVLGTGADVLIDTNAYNRDHGSQLIGSKAVLAAASSSHRPACIGMILVEP